jgi:hypothetical protein
MSREPEYLPPLFADIDLNESSASPRGISPSGKEETPTEPSDDEFALPDSPAPSQKSEGNPEETTVRSEVKASNLTQATMNPIDIIAPARHAPIPSDIRLTSATQEVYSEPPTIKQNRLEFGVADAFERATTKFHRHFQRELEVMLTSPQLSFANGLITTFGISLGDQLQQAIEETFQNQGVAIDPGLRALNIGTIFDGAHRDLRQQLSAAVEGVDRREDRFVHSLTGLQAQLMDTDRRWKTSVSQVIGALAIGATNLSCAHKTRISENMQRQEVFRQLSLARLKLDAQLNRHFRDQESFDREAFVFGLARRELDYYSSGLPPDTAPEHEAIVHELMVIELAMNEEVYQGVIERAAAELEREKRHLTQSLTALDKVLIKVQATPKKEETSDRLS